MSYDLYFRSRSANRNPTPQDFLTYLAGRQNYQISATQAWYENKNTGVYFSFEIGDSTRNVDQWGWKNRQELLPIEFNINYFRPHVFGLEAELEVSALVDHFELQVSDPQTQGMGEGNYSREGLIRGYNAGNEIAYKECLRVAEGAVDARPMPTSLIESIWRWNFDSERFNNELGPTIYVPRIMYLLVAGSVKTAVVWSDGMAITLPDVDIVALYRDHLLTRRWFGQSERIAYVWYKEIQPILAGFPRKQSAMPYTHLDYGPVPAEIEKHVQRAKSTVPARPQLLQTDQILNSEVLERD